MRTFQDGGVRPVHGRQPSKPGRGAALITGAGNGIGRATALMFAEAGWPVSLFDLDTNAIEAVAAICRGFGVVSLAQTGDVTNEEALSSAVTRTEAVCGTVSALVASAGIGRYAPMLELEAADWRSMWEVNLLGSLNAIRATLPGMAAAGNGHIVLIGSRRGLSAASGTSAYSSSKAAVVMLARALTAEVREMGVRVTLINPGGTRTSFRNTPAESKPTDWLSPTDVAAAILFAVGLSKEVVVSEMLILPHSAA